MNLVGIVLKDQSEKALDMLHELTKYLGAKKIKHIIIPSRLGDIDAKEKKQISKCDISVALGGDGTLLFAARNFSKYNIPIVGINLGGLGFITEFRESELLECMECIISSKQSFDERMMIDVQVYRNKKRSWVETGLNDLVINTGGISRLILLEVYSGKHLIGRYRSDGIIVATPTGSTAYSLSAGGPILEPNMKAFVISPICPHSLGARPLIVPTEESIKILMLSQNLEITATVDGQVAFSLQYGDEIRILKSDIITRLVSLHKRSFYDIVREKLSWKA
ncbi:MAG: NAD(+)/NADH kinase [Spirochaetota bacterium]|nr:MAG: NAD(+)/NADH kinase [Spirochaetota bacterium]